MGISGNLLSGSWCSESESRGQDHQVGVVCCALSCYGGRVVIGMA
jgi:hypothetical protein